MIHIFGQLEAEDLPALLTLQEQVFEKLENPDLLRRNSPERLTWCLEAPNIALGFFDEGGLAAAGILVEPAEGETDLRKGLVRHQRADRAADLKLILVRPDRRGEGLQMQLMGELETRALAAGYGQLCVSVAPDNLYSRRNILAAGYTPDHTECLYGGLLREVLVKDLS